MDILDEYGQHRKRPLGQGIPVRIEAALPALPSVVERSGPPWRHRRRYCPRFL